jgi:hypothetical protein
MKIAGLLLVILGVVIGALALVMAAVPRWPGSVHDPSANELRFFGTLAAALFVLGLFLLLDL